MSKEHGKDFDFFKQHYVCHIIEDIRRKGTTDNTSTRPGEGFQQEAAEAFEQTNKKNAEKQVCSLSITHFIIQVPLTLVIQMVKIDANQEAIALIRMAIDNDNKSRIVQAETDINDREPDSEVLSLKQHWTFGSRSSTRLDSRVLEKQLASDDHDFISFDERLRSFIAHCFPEEAPRYEDLVYVCLISCLPSSIKSLKLFNRFNVSNASQSGINLWRTGQSATIFCVAIQISINVSDMTVLLSTTTALGPQSHVSVHYYGVGYHLER